MSHLWTQFSRDGKKPAAALAAVAISLSPYVRASDDAIATDRPDFVESSDVVGRGVFQLETSLAQERDRSAGLKTKVLSTPTLLRLGLSETLELRLESDGLISQTVTGATGSTKDRGTADTSLGVKWHLQDGDESGRPGTALLAHVDLDSGSTTWRGPGKVPSLRFVAEWDLPGDASFGVMPGFAYAIDDLTGKRYWRGIFAATYSQPLHGALRGFVEVAGQELQSKRHGGNVASFDTGLTYAVDNDTQWDLSMNLGLTKSTPDRLIAIGFSHRFR